MPPELATAVPPPSSAGGDVVRDIVLENVGCAMAVGERDGLLTGWSPSAQELFSHLGFGPGILPAALPAQLWGLIAASEPGVAVQWRADEPRGLILGCTRYALGANRWLLIMSEISQKQTLLAQRLQHQRLEALGRLVATTAHDLRAPLSSIVFNSEVLASRFAELPAERAIEAVGDIKTSATRLRGTIECLLDYVRIGPPVAVELSIREILQKTQSFLRPLLRAGGHRILDLTDADNDVVLGNRLAVEQIFLNLLMNAMEAATGPATIRVSSMRHGDRQRILVEDDGPGIAAEHGRQIFDPFFTTKPGGTGIGLSAAREAARAAGGDLELIRSVGGAVFAVTLPCRTRR